MNAHQRRCLHRKITRLYPELGPLTVQEAGWVAAAAREIKRTGHWRHNFISIEARLRGRLKVWRRDGGRPSRAWTRRRERSMLWAIPADTEWEVLRAVPRRSRSPWEGTLLISVGHTVNIEEE